MNGPYDGGIDLEIRVDRKEIRQSVQITVQKTAIEKKIYDDCSKASQLAEQYGYLKQLDFYCSIKLSGQKKREIKKKAKIDYSITLEIFDANDLAELSEEHKSIKRKIYEIYQLVGDGELLNEIDNKTKVLFDLLAEGKDASEIKKQFIHSIIYVFLYENGPCNEQDVISGLREHLGKDKNYERFIQAQISSLRMKGSIQTGAEKGLIVLSEQKSNEIQDIIQITNSQENIFKEEISTALEKFNLQKFADEIVDFLYRSFVENYNYDFEELSETNQTQFGGSIKRIYNDLNRFIDSHFSDGISPEEITKELIAITSKSEYLNKISASVLFTKLYESDKLNAYVNNKSQEVLLDTQILLRLICIQYQPADYPDVAYQAVKNFYETVKIYQRKVILLTTHDYIAEVAGHIQEALKLERFYSLTVIKQLGGQSKNVFYNYFKFLVDNKSYDRDLGIKDFIDDLLGIELPSYKDESFIRTVVNRLEEIFRVLNIDVVYHQLYPLYQNVKREYELYLMTIDKHRSFTALENDLRTILFLSTTNFDDRNEYNNPILLTWDSLFYGVRKRILEKFPDFKYWFIYSPAKLADKLSLVNFKLNPSAINQNIVSIAESNFNYSSRTKSFLDIMSTLFNAEDLSEMKLAHKIIELEKQTKNTSEIPDVHDIQEESSPVTDVLLEVRNYYSHPDNKFNTEDLVKSFENDLYTDALFEILSSSIKHYKEKNEVNKRIFESINEIIVKIQSS